MENVNFIIDIDGVLSHNNALVNCEFKNWLMKWSRNKKIYLTTDYNFGQTLNLLGSYLCLSVTEIHHSAGNGVWSGGFEKTKSRWQVSGKPQAWLEFEFRKSSFQTHATTKLENRTGMLYASTIGSAPTDKEMVAYAEWDNEHGERQAIISNFNKTFPELTSRLSGDYGICVTEPNKDHRQLINKLHKENLPIVYIGYDWNNDEYNNSIISNLDESIDKYYFAGNWKSGWQLLKTHYPL